MPAYLNGLGEAVGEMRRYILDSLRRGDTSRCESLLSVMDDIYSLLMAMDYPDMVTHGLRRNSDAARGLIERTRGDLTNALRQDSLEAKLAEFEKGLLTKRSALPKVYERDGSIVIGETRRCGR
jgi:translin